MLRPFCQCLKHVLQRAQYCLYCPLVVDCSIGQRKTNIKQDMWQIKNSKYLSINYVTIFFPKYGFCHIRQVSSYNPLIQVAAVIYRIFEPVIIQVTFLYFAICLNLIQTCMASDDIPMGLSADFQSLPWHTTSPLALVANALSLVFSISSWWLKACDLHIYFWFTRSTIPSYCSDLWFTLSTISSALFQTGCEH